MGRPPSCVLGAFRFDLKPRYVDGKAHMADLAWLEFLQRHPDAHLIVATTAQASDMLQPPRQDLESRVLPMMKGKLERMIAGLLPQGDYSITLARHLDEPVIFCGFQHEYDAVRFATAMAAHATSRYGNWQSQRAFRISDASLAQIDAEMKWGDLPSDSESARCAH